jgi:hypothetical protein
LRTFAITDSSGIPCNGGSNWLSAQALSRAELHCRESLGPKPDPGADALHHGVFSGDELSSQNLRLDGKIHRLLGKHVAGNGWLEGGGRSSLLESAQEATPTSLHSLGFPSQSHGIGMRDSDGKFTIAAPGGKAVTEEQ